MVADIDLDLLDKALEGIDQTQTKKAKDLHNRLCHEALISAEPERGISFTDMLVLLAHYKLVDDDKALQWVFYY
jgi:voltage-dependent calcium channel